jgi:hypothetical protein
MNYQIVNITLNSFDGEGNQVDTDNMDLTPSQASDIIDHAAQLVVVLRNIAEKKDGIEAFDHVYAELEEALQNAGVVEETAAPMPVLTLHDSTGHTHALRCDDEEHATILAALRFYQQEGMSDPLNRSDAIQEIACPTDDSTSLDDSGIDELCERINQ